MIKPDDRFEIRTLGCFSITLSGQPVVTCWPDKIEKTLFCSLLSPLDLYFTWDRISRSLLGEPETQVSRRHLEENIIRPLKSFLINELGFNPLIISDENIRVDRQRMNVDVFEFHNSAVEGLKLLTNGNHLEAKQKLHRAKSLYAGSYLPEMAGKIIANTRDDLEALYQKVVSESARLVAITTFQAVKVA